jgi:hypothetical protein
VAIATDDTWAHVYPSLAGLLADDDIGTGPEERRGPLDFFDDRGHCLAPVFDTSWQLMDLVPGSPARPGQVRERLRHVLEHARTYLQHHPDMLFPYGMDMDEAMRLIPQLEDGSLRDAVRLFAADPERGDIGAGALADEDSGGWWHNLRHRAGWDH